LTDLAVVLKEKEDGFTRMEGLSSATDYEEALSTPSIEGRACPRVLYSHINEIYPFWW